MKQININVYGDCETLCPYYRECACHYTAGDFRSESGFTPQIFVDTETGQLFCATAEEPPHTPNYPQQSAKFPENIEFLSQGYHNIGKARTKALS